MLVSRVSVLRDSPQMRKLSTFTLRVTRLARKGIHRPSLQLERGSRHCFHHPSNHLRPQISPHCRYTTQTDRPSTSFSDPVRPDIFYHLVHRPRSDVPSFALSFLPTPPPSADSVTIIGWLPASTEGQDGEAGLNDFEENSE
jgi:hypothetical protein